MIELVKKLNFSQQEIEFQLENVLEILWTDELWISYKFTFNLSFILFNFFKKFNQEILLFEESQAGAFCIINFAMASPYVSNMLTSSKLTASAIFDSYIVSQTREQVGLCVTVSILTRCQTDVT